jgi:8-oxo-dGTP pyrophosphatase MutT (NUDIX family)
MGAGILPTSIYKGKLYFLFGKENKYADTPGWSDFGGGTDNNETFLQTAMREGSEELTGFLGDKSSIKSLLSKSFYYLDNKPSYRMFLLPYQYDPMLPFYYNNNHKYIEEKLDKEIIKKSKIFEKCEIKWVCIDDLNKMKNKVRSYFKDTIDKLIEEREEIYRFIKKKLNTHSKTKKNNF